MSVHTREGRKQDPTQRRRKPNNNNRTGGIFFFSDKSMCGGGLDTKFDGRGWKGSEERKKEKRWAGGKKL